MSEMGFHNFNRSELRCMLYTYDELKEDGIDVDACPFWRENFHDCCCSFCIKQPGQASPPPTRVRVPTVSSKKGTTAVTTVSSGVKERLDSYTVTLRAELEAAQLSTSRLADILEALQKDTTSEDGRTLVTVELLRNTKIGYLLNKKVRKLDVLRLPINRAHEGRGDASKWNHADTPITPIARANTAIHTMLTQWKSLTKKGSNKPSFGCKKSEE